MYPRLQIGPNGDGGAECVQLSTSLWQSAAPGTGHGAGTSDLLGELG